MLYKVFSKNKVCIEYKFIIVKDIVSLISMRIFPLASNILILLFLPLSEIVLEVLFLDCLNYACCGHLDNPKSIKNCLPVMIVFDFGEEPELRSARSGE